MKKSENSINLNISIKKSHLKLFSALGLIMILGIATSLSTQKNDDFNIDKAGLFSLATTNTSMQQGKYSVSSSSANMNGAIMTHVVILNTQTGQSKLFQLFNDKHGGGWKVIELSSSRYNLGIPKVNF